MWLSVLPSLSSRMTGASASSALRGVDDDRQRLVLDVDQLERVARGVAVVGDDEGDLLALEAHLVGGQHGLRVGRQRRHPGQAQPLEVLAGDRPRAPSGAAARAEVSIETMRACASGLRSTAPCSMPGQRDVVDVVALAADEARVLLALAAGRSRSGAPRRRPSVAASCALGSRAPRARPPSGPPRRCSCSPCSGRSGRRSRRGSRRRSGAGCASSSARAVSIMPGVQKPHCRPCSSMKPCCTGSSAPSRSRPSTVRTSWPSAIAASMVHDLTGSPSIEHDAGAAVGRVAAPVGAGQPERVAQEVDEQRARLDVARDAPRR